MKTFRINTTVDRGIKSENKTLKFRAKDEAEAMKLAREYWESQGREVIHQWRGLV